MADEKIKGDTPFSELLQKYPETAPIMMKHGLHCIGCHAAAFETIEQGCTAHGMKEEDIKKMLREMNEAIEKK
jgi:hybrid cluster-associated redox disulfide protein